MMRVGMESLIATVSGAAVRRRRWFVAAWIVLLLVALPFSGKAQGVLSSGGFDVPGSQSEKVIDYLNSQPGGGAYAFTFLIAAPTAQQAAAREAQLRSEVAKQFPQVRMRSDVAASPDKATVALTGYARVDQNKSLELSRRLKDALQVTDGPTRTFLLGASANYATFQQITEDDLRQAEALSSPVILIVLLVLFGAVVAALLPALLGLFSVVITFAGVYAVASATEVSVYATTMVTMIGIGVAVDYSMFVLARFRDELEDGAVVETAVATAMRTSGTAVVFSGITVIVSLASIWIVPVRAVQSMALAAIMVVAVTIAATLTLLPALLAIVGRRVNSGRIGRRREEHLSGLVRLLAAVDGGRHAPAAALLRRRRGAADRADHPGALDGHAEPRPGAVAALDRRACRHRPADQPDHRRRPGPRGIDRRAGAPGRRFRG